MLATAAHGEAYTFAEYKEILVKAGIVSSEFQALPTTIQQVVVSRKS